MAAEQTLAALPYDLRRKDVGGRGYLYEIHDRAGNGRSLGPWSEGNEAKFTAYREAKAAAKARREASGKSLNETARLKFPAHLRPPISNNVDIYCTRAWSRLQKACRIVVSKNLTSTS